MEIDYADKKIIIPCINCRPVLFALKYKQWGKGYIRDSNIKGRRFHAYINKGKAIHLHCDRTTKDGFHSTQLYEEIWKEANRMNNIINNTASQDCDKISDLERGILYVLLQKFISGRLKTIKKIIIKLLVKIT